MSAFLEAFRLVAAPDVLIAILAASVYGLVVGCLPGLSATMATALLVPVTFYLSPIAAVATIISASAMAIFSGDIPGCLLRIPGTPASAAYTDEAYAMTRNGQAELALGAGLWFSAIGGIAGTISLVVMAWISSCRATGSHARATSIASRAIRWPSEKMPSSMLSWASEASTRARAGVGSRGTRSTARRAAVMAAAGSPAARRTPASRSWSRPSRTRSPRVSRAPMATSR